MKIFIHCKKGPIGQALGAVASLSGHCEIIENITTADEILCTDVNTALDMLFAGRKVILVIIGKDILGAESLSKNERFKDSLAIFNFSFTEGDGPEMQRFISYFAKEKALNARKI